jgi:hypothetical protein
MTRIAALVSLLFIPLVLVGQQDTAKAPPLGWKHKVVVAMNLTQVAFNNWTQGGENAFAWAASLDGKHTQLAEKTDWTSAYRFAYGQAKLQSSGLRKTDDVIDLSTTLTYLLGTMINPYVGATLKTQFARGFDYGAAGSPAVSRFFDPGYMTQSAGVGYQPVPELKTRLGAALRETFTSQFKSYANDPGTKPADMVSTRVEGGAESVTEVDWKFATNMSFAMKLELFAPFKTIDKIIVHDDMGILAKVNDVVTVGITVQLINDWRATPRTQSKQTLAIGLSYALL